MAEDLKDILLPNEAEAFVESLTLTNIKELGSSKWFRTHEMMYKLSVQASLSVKQQKEEYVKDFFVSIGKVLVVIHDLVVLDVWKENILPEILKFKHKTASTVPLYAVMYHEVVLVSLLETILFNEDAMESASDLLTDLADYCYRKIIDLLQKPQNYQEDNHESETDVMKLTFPLSFEIGMKAITILSYLVQHAKSIPISVLHRLLNIYDVPLLFVKLMQDIPWKRQVKNDVEIYTDGKWRKQQHFDTFKLLKVEGQIWIGLITLLLNEHFVRNYDINDYKKSQLLKLRSKINEVVMDQIPMLRELLRFLETLSLFDPQPPKPNIIIEQVSEIREPLIRNHEKDWKTIAKLQVDEYFSKSQMDAVCKRLADAYNTESLEAVLSDMTICAQCHKAGLKRCSRCSSEYYCNRDCQVLHWPKHKLVCEQLVRKD